jgi:hypothetical protein
MRAVDPRKNTGMTLALAQGKCKVGTRRVFLSFFAALRFFRFDAESRPPRRIEPVEITSSPKGHNAHRWANNRRI